jgi:glycopeptide antibiotics resistance protein
MFDIGLDTAGDVFMCFCGFFIVCGLADWISKRNKV